MDEGAEEGRRRGVYPSSDEAVGGINRNRK